MRFRFLAISSKLWNHDQLPRCLSSMIVRWKKVLIQAFTELHGSSSSLGSVSSSFQSRKDELCLKVPSFWRKWKVKSIIANLKKWKIIADIHFFTQKKENPMSLICPVVPHLIGCPRRWRSGFEDLKTKTPRSSSGSLLR